MKKLFSSILVLGLLFGGIVSAEAEYSVLEKTNKYIIIKADQNMSQDFGYSSPAMRPPKVDAMDKLFKIAVSHCSLQYKKAYIFFKEVPMSNIFYGTVNYRYFDQRYESFSGNINEYRFFCGDDEYDASSVLKSVCCGKENFEKFKSIALVNKYNGIDLSKSSLRYWVEESEEVAEKRRQKLAKIEAEKEKKLMKEKQTKEKSLAEKKLKEQEELAAKEQEAKKLKLVELDKSYGDVCKKGWFGRGFEKGTKQYEDCLINEDNKVLAKEKERKNLALAEKNRLENEAKLEAEKFAKMSADNRRDYICQNKFGFKKNSTKFQDCRFKLFTGEMELEKLQIQKELAQEKLEAAKASEAAAKATAQLAQSTQARQEALAQAQIQASQMQAAAAAVQAYAIQQQGAQEMMDRGLDMLSGRRGVDGSIRSAPSAPIINRQVCTSIVISRNPYTTREVCR